MPTHIMLDLETLGSAPGSVILSIGAVAFDQTDIVSKFTAHLNARSCQQAGLTIDATTVMWWFGQDDAAREGLLYRDAVPLAVALEQFSGWIWQHSRPLLWSKGPSFDAAILAAAYRAVDRPLPWHYRDERCVRTACELAGVEIGKFPSRLRHDALSDATAQAEAMQEVMRRGERARGG